METPNNTVETLNLEHVNHLLAEGFTPEHIDTFVSNGLVKSLTADEAYKAGFSVAIERIPVTGGLLFQFSSTFAQLRLDNQNIIPKDRNDSDSKYAKYLSLGGTIDRDCAYIPDGCKAVTEGMKDALAFTHIGGIPTGAVAGVSHITKALPKGCGHTIVFDYDAWENFQVFKNLIRAGVHCGGKVAIVPAIDGEPKAGACEYFKGGRTAEDCQQLLDNAQTSEELFKTWFDRQQVNDVTTAVELAIDASKLIGELFGYASSVTVEHIKDMLKTTRLSEWNLTASNILRDSGNTQSSQKGKAKDEDEGDTDPRKAVKIAIDIVKTRADLFHSQAPDSEDYASIPSKNGVMTTHTLDSREFKSWVVGEYYRETGDGLTGEQINSVLATIHAIAAHDSPELPVSEKRIAEHNGRYYLYLADEAQTVIEYSAVGWSVCENSPVKFVFDKYKAPLPIPSKNGSIDKLWKLTRIKDTPESPDRLMIVSALVKGLVPGGSDLILAISGYAGSGKTTTAKYLRALIDPFTKGKVLSKLPENSDNIAIHCMKRRIFAIDNISHITSEQSDFLCNVTNVDSGGTSKREHHTNSSEIIHDIQNLVIITSIGNVVTKPDLLERSIVIDLPRLTSDDRESEAELAEIFDRHHGEILGGLLDITVAALHYRDTNKCPKFNRLTEFAHLGVGVEAKLNYPIGSIEKRFADNANIANEIAIDASPVASTLRSWILEHGEVWTGTMSDLLNVLKTHAKKSELAGTLPKTANSLGGELKKCESALFESGVIIEDFRESRANDPSQTKKKKVYLRSQLPKTSENPSPRSPHPQDTELELLSNNGSSRVEQTENPSPHVRLTDITENLNNSTEPLIGNGSSRGEQVSEHEIEQITDDEYPYTDDV
jgi:energy-coupling factor transporter ATP-binding protein EcfA2